MGACQRCSAFSAKRILCICVANLAVFFLVVSPVFAVITATGAVSPSNPALWTSDTLAYVGQYASGKLVVNGGSKIISDAVFINYLYGGASEATVSGTGSEWIGRYVSVGESGTGSLNVLNGAFVSFSWVVELGYESGARGAVTVDGTGSRWTSGSVYVGYEGTGTFNITNGGFASVSGAVTLGVHDGAPWFPYRAYGEMTVVGTGSKLTCGSLDVGEFASGAIKILNGGVVAADSFSVGRYDGANGEATVSGTGSALRINDYCSVGSGTLNILNGAAVSCRRSYSGYAAASSTVINVSGTGSTWTCAEDIRVGGSSSLNISEGAVVASSTAYLTGFDGASGAATVSGTGSKWTCSDGLYVGFEKYGGISLGAGTLSISDGGLVSVVATVAVGSAGQINFNGGTLSAKTLLAGSRQLSGTGVVNVLGLVSDVNLVFDSEESRNQTFSIQNEPGQNILVHLRVDAWRGAPQGGDLGVGYSADRSAAMNISNGVAIYSTNGFLGYLAGSSGAASVSGTGSVWALTSNLSVGYQGTGTLNISCGGSVGGFIINLGYDGGSSGTATVSGSGSILSADFLRVGCPGLINVVVPGTGTLNLVDGGTVFAKNASVGAAGHINFDGGTLNADALFVSTGQLTGTGVVNVFGLVSDMNLVLDSQASLQRTFAFDSEAGRNVVVNLDLISEQYSRNLGAGYLKSGALTVTNGVAVDSFTGYLGYLRGSSGTAVVAGPGSAWKNRLDLYVGYQGTGTLNITNGGSASSYYVDIGFLDGSLGTVNVRGTGSKLTCDSTLRVEAGSLNISDGASVCVAGSVGVSASGTISIAGGTLELSGDLWLNEGSKLALELGPLSTSDKISMAYSTLRVSTLEFSDFTLTAIDGISVGTYTLIDAGSIDGGLGENISGWFDGCFGTLAISGNDVVLNVTAVPEPGVCAIIVGMAAALVLGRKIRK